MKALVLWTEAHSTNLGVRALGAGAAAIARQAWPDVELSYQGYGPGDAPQRIANPKRLVKQSLTRSSPLLDWVRTFDVVLDTRAGDSFSDIYGLERLTAMSAVTEFTARRARVPVVMMPQTLGPFTHRRGRLIARSSMRAAKVVMARDTESARYAASLGRPVDVTATDVVFALPPAAPSDSRDVVLNVSGLLWAPNSHVDSAQYQQTIVALVRGLLADGRRVTLMPHVLDSELADNDVPASTELAGRFDGDLDVVVPADLDDARRVLASAQLVIGSRMHACLNALSLGVPAVPLAYSRKFAPLLADLGWQHTVDLRAGRDQAEQARELATVPGLADEVRDVLSRAGTMLEPAVAALRGAL